MHGVHHTEYDMGVYGSHQVTMATNCGNENHFERISYSSYKISSDKDIARFLNEIVFKMTEMLQCFLETIFAVSEFIKHYVYMPLS